MERISDQERLRPWMGFVLFAVLMAFFLTVCQKLQLEFGIAGLIATEISFLGIALLFCRICGVKIKEVFPVKKIKLREFFGCLFLEAGGLSLSILSVAIVATIIPASASETQELSSFLYGQMNYPLTVLVVALMPAICEEAIHRGAILSCFRGLKRDWVIVLIMGLLFGINHMSILRFGATAILGAILSYVVVKSNNILLSMLIHFMNNLLSSTVGYLTADTLSTAGNVDYSSVLGTYLILGFSAPVLIVLGAMLISPKSHRKIRFLYAGILAGVMLIAGLVFNAVNMQKNLLLQSTIGYTVTEDAPDCDMLDFTVENDRDANVTAVLMQARGSYRLRIDGDNGSNIINAEFPEGALRTVTYNVSLKKGHYTVTLIGEDGSLGENPNMSIVIQ